jgi:hypothetical protein
MQESEEEWTDLGPELNLGGTMMVRLENGDRIPLSQAIAEGHMTLGGTDGDGHRE